MATQVNSAIQALSEAFADCINAGDADALADVFYAQDALLLPPNHPAVRGRSHIREFWQGLLNAGLSDLSLETVDTRASGGLAFATDSYTLVICTPAGEPLRDSGKWIAIYRRQADGLWRAVNHMFSSDQASV